MSLVPSHLRLHTRYRPGDVLVTVKNGSLPPPPLLVKSTGLPAYTDSLSAATGLAQAGMPLPIGRYTTRTATRVGLHDQDDLTAYAATNYRAAGYQIVELPSGELRILDPSPLVALPDSPLQLKPSPIAPLAKAMGGDWTVAVRQHHLTFKHGHPDPSKLSAAEMDVWHSTHHATHGEERLKHTHGRGILALRKALATPPGWDDPYQGPWFYSHQHRAPVRLATDHTGDLRPPDAQGHWLLQGQPDTDQTAGSVAEQHLLPLDDALHEGYLTEDDLPEDHPRSTKRFGHAARQMAAARRVMPAYRQEGGGVRSISRGDFDQLSPAPSRHGLAKAFAAPAEQARFNTEPAKTVHHCARCQIAHEQHTGGVCPSCGGRTRVGLLHLGSGVFEPASGA